jgi:hypothetical protein
MPRASHSRKARNGIPRRSSPPREDGWAVIDVRSAPLGPGVTCASIEEVLAVLQGFDPDLGWNAIADDVIPLFQRVRPYPPEFPEAVRTILPPGISVSFAIDVGPAFTHITAEFLERWGLTVGAVAERAIANLDRRAAAAARTPLVTEPVDGVPVRTLQSGTGSASTFVLVPERLPALFGHEAQFFIAPLRDVLISLPADVDRGFAGWLLNEFAELDPNHLAPIGFAFHDKKVSVEPLGEAVAIA